MDSGDIRKGPLVLLSQYTVNEAVIGCLGGVGDGGFEGVDLIFIYVSGISPSVGWPLEGKKPYRREQLASSPDCKRGGFAEKKRHTPQTMSLAQVPFFPSSRA